MDLVWTSKRFRESDLMGGFWGRVGVRSEATLFL